MVDPMAVGRSAAMLGVGGTVAALGAAVGFGSERYVMGRSLRADDPYAEEPLGGLRGTPYAVEVSDGVQLHAEVDGEERPGLSVVFAHGYGLNHDTWHFQRRDLGDVGRLVFYDQRSHGRSGRAAGDQASIHRLGTDLGEMLDVLVPPGPVVLVGHSMGGMTIMSLADQRPELFQERVVGVGLVATSASLADGEWSGLEGRMMRAAQRYGPVAMSTAATQPEVVESVRRSGSDLAYVLTKRYSFSREDVSPSLVEFTSAMLAGTPVGVYAEFLPEFGIHDRKAALLAMDSVEVLVIGATEDRMTPVEHAREMVSMLPTADYVEIPDAGHMVMLEYPDLVTAHLRSLVARAARGTSVEIEDPGAAPVPLPRPEKRSRFRRGRRA